MILRQVIALFDEELDRLHQLRAVVTDLQGVFVLPQVSEPTRNYAAAPEVAAAPTTVVAPPAPKPLRMPKPVRIPKTAERKPRAPRMVKRAASPTPESSALRGSIPKGPVVVSAAQVRSQSVRSPQPAPGPRAVPEAVPERGSLGSMIRALRLEAS